MANPVVHFEVIGKNAKTLRNFYKQAFDWQIEAPIPGSPLDYALVHPQTEHGINGGIGASTEDCARHVTFYVGVPDVAAALSKIETLGGKRVTEPEVVPGGITIALFADPEDNNIGLVQT
jgi:predicted enzyme related to lactoylglutathione lyase